MNESSEKILTKVEQTPIRERVEELETINVKKTGEEKTDLILAKQEDFAIITEKMFQEADSALLSKEEIRETGKKMGFWNKIQELTEKSKQAGQEALESLKKIISRQTAALTLSGVTLFSPGVFQELAGLPETIDTPKQERTIKEINNEQIFKKAQAWAMNSIKEKQFLIAGEGNFAEMREGSEAFVEIELKEIKAIIAEKEAVEGQKIDKVSFGHTHPLETYKFFGYPEEVIEKMRRGEQKVDPFPPSYYDLNSAVAVQYFFEKEGIATEEMVVDGGGVWTFTSDKSHPYVKEMRKASIFDENFQKRLENFSLTEKEKASLRKKQEQFKNKDPIKFMEALINDPETARTGKKMKEVLLQMTERINDKGFQRLIFVDETLKKYDQNRTAKERDDLIQEYIAGWAKKGIYMSYAPFEKKPVQSIEIK